MLGLWAAQLDLKAPDGTLPKDKVALLVDAAVKRCGDKDGVTSLTIIDLKVNIDGKPRPMVEQYENHCFIDKKSTTGSDTTLSATCYEFWDDYKKKANGRKATIKLSLASKDALKIDGKAYRRCPAKDAKKKS